MDAFQFEEVGDIPPLCLMLLTPLDVINASTAIFDSSEIIRNYRLVSCEKLHINMYKVESRASNVFCALPFAQYFQVEYKRFFVYIYLYSYVLDIYIFIYISNAKVVLNYEVILA